MRDKQARADSAQTFVVEIDTGPIDNFTIAVAMAADHLRRDLDHDRMVASVSVAASDAERTLALRVTVEAATALAALHVVMTVMERSTQKHNIGDLAVHRINAAPAKPDALREYVDMHDDAPEPTQPAVHRADPGAIQHAAFGAAQALASARHLAADLHAAGGNDSARSIERWLAPGITAQEALRGLHHVLVELRAMSSMPVWNASVGKRIDACLAGVIAAVDAGEASEHR